MKNYFAKRMTEDDVKSKLNIDNFGDLPNEKIAEFASYLDKMDPEVAKVALGQVPEFALTARTAIESIQKVVIKGFESNDMNMRSYFTMAEDTIESLRKRLEEPTISKEEQNQITEKIIEILKMVAEKDSEDKNHISNETTKFVAGALVSVAMVGASIGVSMVLKNYLKRR